MTCLPAEATDRRGLRSESGHGANTTVHPWCEQSMLELTVAS